MEELSLDREMTSRIGILRYISIGLISENRGCIVREMDSNLMCSPSLDSTFEEGILLLDSFSEGCIVSDSSLTIRTHDDFGFIFGMFDPFEIHRYGITSLSWLPDDNSMIDLLYLSILEE